MNLSQLQAECLAAEAEINQKVNNELLPKLRRYQVANSRENFTSFAGSIAQTILSLTDVAHSFGVPLSALYHEIQRCGSVEASNIAEVMMEHMTKQEMGEKYAQKGMVS